VKVIDDEQRMERTEEFIIMVAVPSILGIPLRFWVAFSVQLYG
jgi:nitrate/nitrite transporter NarK